MEKRTMIALGLTIVLLFVFQMYFTPKQQPIQNVPPKQAEDTQAVKEKPAPPPQAENKKPTQRILAETPLLKVTFSDLGGGIESVKLQRYKEKVKKDSAEKELVEDIKPYTYLPRITKVANGETVHDRTYFKPDRTGITVRDQAETLIFSGTLTDGKRIRKIYTLYPDKYTIDMKVEVEATDKDIALMDFAMISGENENTYVFKGPFTYDGKAFQQIEKLKENIEVDRNYKYAGLDDGFFAFIWIPGDESKFPLTITKSETNVPILRSKIDKGMLSGRLYFGPKQADALKALNVNAQKVIDFGWFDIIAKPLVLGMNFSNKVTHNYGIDIILLTILIKIIFYPLTAKSYKSMKEMQKMQPVIMKLKEKYKDDRQKLNMEMMELYKQKGVNPMGGCLPMIIQIPVFFALYKALSGAIELRHAPFMFWINDLSAPEDLYTMTVAGFALPIRILPLVMGITQVIQQKMTPTSVDPLQEKMMLIMPIFFTFLFWGFPSGLVLYWLVNNVISIAQQYYINKKTT
ncbi:MAG: Membrane protein insertase YidC [Syntrophorhabdus sp. PtaU1.Bin002]|nr:MAG: Membrane protein insertase YidC [Syntrophorhabdus sp. PtaB.Bin006]OPY70549.1 MAG: Membrane protein insertase YidC [Syntrophorhabdus sp. PtaU1.Bin002]